MEKGNQCYLLQDKIVFCRIYLCGLMKVNFWVIIWPIILHKELRKGAILSKQW